MAQAPSIRLLRSMRLLDGPRVCSRCLRRGSSVRGFKSAPTPAAAHTAEPSTAQTDAPQQSVPLRKQLKDEARARKSSPKKSSKTRVDPLLDKWELTVGIEVHAELNTTCKLFSSARTSLSSAPNDHVGVFDAAVPGAQPHFQHETLLPALRAALALECKIQSTSSWDRKHYFWWDQPNGYQITQYYAPFAKAGHITLFPHDGIDPADHPSITVGIKQVQMEQDTAKTILQPPTTHMLDFNRASHPLIEIITLPHVHSPKTAAALVRKIQSILQAVDANTTGMEMGGLRADVNVSVRPRHPTNADAVNSTFEYDGVTGLGQRTEIKNLNSIKAVEEAIISERDRQIRVLEAGGTIEGETRGWTIGSTETRRLRGKEGEVDYRYMPDPDLGSVRIGDDLVRHLESTLPVLPDENLKLLNEDPRYRLTMKDAMTLVGLDEGDRLDFYYEALALVRAELDEGGEEWDKAGKLVANTVLHDLPALLLPTSSPFPYSVEASAPPSSAPPLSANSLAAVLTRLSQSQITTPAARKLMQLCQQSPPQESAPRVDQTTVLAAVDRLIDEHNLRLRPLSADEYAALAARTLTDNAEMAAGVRADIARVGMDRAQGKVMWFVGRMLREEGMEGRVQPGAAAEAVKRALTETV